MVKLWVEVVRGHAAHIAALYIARALDVAVPFDNTSNVFALDVDHYAEDKKDSDGKNHAANLPVCLLNFSWPLAVSLSATS